MHIVEGHSICHWSRLPETAMCKVQFYITQKETIMATLPGMKRPQKMLVEISEVRTDLDTQARAKLDPEMVELYAAAMRKGVRFPDILLFKDKKNRRLYPGRRFAPLGSL